MHSLPTLVLLPALAMIYMVGGCIRRLSHTANKTIISHKNSSTYSKKIMVEKNLEYAMINKKFK